ncbi:cell division protein FtsL [Profundibacterium mesophilum]|uniref:Secreted protein n=1 Tax=Profundibacterium mesophilum KAUST100406-0324 TaxID=1037889 RepID=A0A921TCX1_9RHOB|nr:cell division protein FtsL [Profundibacterium mesophilum]KAF0675447.1 Secreted protein [Profundibacterium mesophilum KAUST100406-0324]
MRSIFYVLSALAVMGLAFWAYSENYATREALGEVDDLRAQIAQGRESLSVLRAEYAYLSRPERLQTLADMNFDRLGLLPLLPEQFATIDQIAYPAAADTILLDPIEVSSDGMLTEEATE